MHDDARRHQFPGREELGRILQDSVMVLINSHAVLIMGPRLFSTLQLLGLVRGCALHLNNRTRIPSILPRAKEKQRNAHTNTSTHTIQSMPKHTHYVWQHAWQDVACHNREIEDKRTSYTEYEVDA